VDDFCALAVSTDAQEGLKAFLEKAFDPWMVQGWKDKFASGFTDSASQSGDSRRTHFQTARARK
jgi:hypothetical protein